MPEKKKIPKRRGKGGGNSREVAKRGGVVLRKRVEEVGGKECKKKKGSLNGKGPCSHYRGAYRPIAEGTETQERRMRIEKKAATRQVEPTCREGDRKF